MSFYKWTSLQRKVGFLQSKQRQSKARGASFLLIKQSALLALEMYLFNKVYFVFKGLFQNSILRPSKTLNAFTINIKSRL